MKLGFVMRTIMNVENTRHLASRQRSTREAGQNVSNTGHLVLYGTVDNHSFKEKENSNLPYSTDNVRTYIDDF